MAILNFIKQGTYSTISCLYDKHTPHISVQLSVWETAKKDRLLTNMSYALDGRISVMEVVSILDKFDQIIVGEWHLISEETLDETLLPYAGIGVMYFGEQGNEQGVKFVTYHPREHEVIYVQDQKIHIMRVTPTATSSSHWRRVTDVFDRNTWERYFTMDCIGGVDENNAPRNLYRAVYSYLMTRPEFENTIEG